LLRDAGPSPDEAQCYPLLEALGVPVAAWRFVPADAAPSVLREAASALPAPWVLKACSADLPHKTDAGSVALDIHDAHELQAIATGMRNRMRADRPAARVRGWLVQQQVRAVGELLLGLRRDPVVGPIVVVASGGVEAELLDDVVVAPAPLDAGRARAMLGELRLLPRLTGFRGHPPGDLDALAQAIAAFSRLALDPTGRLVEAEINPLLVCREGEGVVAVDALIRFAA